MVNQPTRSWKQWKIRASTFKQSRLAQGSIPKHSRCSFSAKLSQPVKRRPGGDVRADGTGSAPGTESAFPALSRYRELGLAPMRRYYFDLRDDKGVVVDEEGLDLRDLQAVQEEAARSLSDMARDAMRRSAGTQAGALTQMAIEVRDNDGPVMHVRFTFEIDRKN
jgi:hypothetical protein